MNQRRLDPESHRGRALTWLRSHPNATVKEAEAAGINTGGYYWAKRNPNGYEPLKPNPNAGKPPVIVRGRKRRAVPAKPVRGAAARRPRVAKANGVDAFSEAMHRAALSIGIRAVEQELARMRREMGL
jgi:hypothetical protein